MLSSKAFNLFFLRIKTARKQRVHDYHERKKHIQQVEDEIWKEERDHFEINIPELEQSVYRARRRDILDDLKLPNGIVPTKPPIVYRPIKLQKGSKKQQESNDR